MGKIYEGYLHLMRSKDHHYSKKIKSKCLLSGKLHEQENAFLIIKKDIDVYTVHYCCFRFCLYMRTVEIGSFTIDNQVIMIHPDFQYLLKDVNVKRKKKPKTIEI